jgi:hypothetical protein
MEETSMQKTSETGRQDLYTRITAQIVASLENGVRPWAKPWNAEHAAGSITRPLRHNGQPYSGINVISLWASAFAQNFASLIWVTFRQALELDGHVQKGERGSLVVYADRFTKNGGRCCPSAVSLSRQANAKRYRRSVRRGLGQSGAMNFANRFAMGCGLMADF